MNISIHLLNDCIAQKRKAQFELYRQCYPMLMSVCLRYRKNRDEAEGLLNQAFLKIFNNLKKYNPSVPFEAWIRRITINTIIDDYRKQQRVESKMQYTDFEGADSYKEPVDFNRAEQLFDAQQIEQLIHRLSPMARQVFNLFAIDGYGHKEIGKMLRITEGTSKWHLSDARKKLKQMLQELLEEQKCVNQKRG